MRLPVYKVEAKKRLFVYRRFFYISAGSPQMMFGQTYTLMALVSVKSLTVSARFANS